MENMACCETRILIQTSDILHLLKICFHIWLIKNTEPISSTSLGLLTCTGLGKAHPRLFFKNKMLILEVGSTSWS